GYVYNGAFFNDGYHTEHHSLPAEHWTRLPQRAIRGSNTSRWPAVLRWIEVVNLDMLERFVLQSRTLQKFMLRTHERALRRILSKLPPARTITIVGGGMFPRTAILLEKLIPEAKITIIDANAASIQAARKFLSPGTKLVHEFFDPSYSSAGDLMVIPLSFVGNRDFLYRRPPATTVLIHDWIWAKRNEGVVVSPWLLKRINIIRR